MHHAVVVLLGILACAAPASANWRSLKSNHFLVIGDASERDLRDVALRLEQFREVVSRRVPAALRDDSPPPPSPSKSFPKGSFRNVRRLASANLHFNQFDPIGAGVGDLMAGAAVKESPLPRLVEFEGHRPRGRRLSSAVLQYDHRRFVLMRR